MSKLQNQDFKTQAQLEGVGASKADLLNDSKIYVTANSLNKRLDEAIVDGDIGAGGGGLDIFYSEPMDKLDDVSNFSTGNNASFMGGGSILGTLALETASPLAGEKSLKYTQASGSLNDYFASEIIEVDLKQQNNTSGMTLYFTYDGDANDGRFIVWDETNDQEISNQLALVETASKATRYSLSFHVPASCTQIRWGYQVLVENVGAMLLVDDVEMSSDPFVNVETCAIGNPVTYSATLASFGTTSNERFTWHQEGKYMVVNFRFTAGTTTASLGTISLPSGYNIDADSLTIVNNNSSNRGSIVGWFNDSFPNANRRGNILTAPATQTDRVYISILDTGVGDSTVPSDALGSVASNQDIIGYFKVPIAGWSSSTESTLTPSDTFSTDTAPLSYAPSSQYTLSTLEDAPIGTFITFTYAANTNTRTQTTTAPSQSTADMNQNGIRIFARPIIATSTAAQPSAIAIQIGKGMKAADLKLYNNASRDSVGSLEDLYSIDGGSDYGARTKEYNEKTGVLVVDAGLCWSGGSSSHIFFFADGSSQNNGYLTINAGKTLPLLAIPTPKVAYLKDIKLSGTAGGTFTSGAWRTRTLNTVEGDGSIVSLNANQFVLQPGKYEIEASAPALGVNINKAKLVGDPSGTPFDAIIGTSEYTNSANIYATTFSKMKGTISISVSTTFEIQHQCGVSRGSVGLGIASSFGVSELYTICKITKLS